MREADIGGSCIYCSKPLDTKWVSQFSAETHYKCVLCSCGKENCVEVDYIGTGHDNMSGLEKRVEGESRIRVVEKNIRILR